MGYRSYLVTWIIKVDNAWQTKHVEPDSAQAQALFCDRPTFINDFGLHSAIHLSGDFAERPVKVS